MFYDWSGHGRWAHCPPCTGAPGLANVPAGLNCGAPVYVVPNCPV